MPKPSLKKNSSDTIQPIEIKGLKLSPESELNSLRFIW